MSKTFNRTDRVAQLIQTELAKIIQQEMRDSRMSLVTITDVDITRDLAYAKIYVSVFTEKENEISDIVKKLNESGKLLRFRLANEITLRKTPQLKFLYDNSIVKGNKLSSLINHLMHDENNKNDTQ